MRRTYVLAGMLGIAMVSLVALWPTLQRLREETGRIDDETARAMSQANEFAVRSNALEKSRAATVSNPDDAAAWMRLASAAQEVGRVDEALEAVDRAVRLNPSDTTPVLAKADILQRARRYDQAISTYRELLTREPHLPRAVAGLSFIYLALGWNRDARTLLDSALTVHGTDRSLRMAKAFACVQQSEFNPAERLLLDLRKEDSADPALWGALADLYLKALRPADAVRVLEDARRDFGDNPKIPAGFAQAYVALGKLREAESIAAQAIEAGNPTPSLRWHRALALQRLGRAGEALSEMEKLHAVDPEFDGLRLMLGQALVRAGRKDEGQRMLAVHRDTAAKSAARTRTSLRVTMNPGDPQAHLAMARVYFAEGSEGKMRAEAQRALELNPRLREASDLLKRGRP